MNARSEAIYLKRVLRPLKNPTLTPEFGFKIAKKWVKSSISRVFGSL